MNTKVLDRMINFKFIIKLAIIGAILAAGLLISLPIIAEMSREGAELIAVIINVVTVLLFLNVLFIDYSIFPPSDSTGSERI